MKKVFFLVLMCLLLVGCGGKPSGVSDEMYEVALYTVKSVDLYLDGEQTLDETYEKIDSLNSPDVPDVESKDFSINTAILNVRIKLLANQESIGTSDLSELREARNELAKKINYKK